MKREELFQALIVAEYLAFIVATVLVVIFQFLGIGLLITVALAMYVVAFALCAFENIVLCVELFKVKDSEVEQNIPNLNLETADGEKITVKAAKNNIKSRKIKAVAMSVISGLIAIFTLVVLVLFR